MFLSLGAGSSIQPYISPVPPGLQGDCKANDLDKGRCKIEAGMPSFSPAFS
jgi:hypothetical protein